ncbi:hypothetical protein LOC71_01320 [Rhodopirellula sp. JC740]|uniref:Uncharacterized protein n=1 Tax=Rhodopirellula halodulae TaxID=2894198 RepID=A0ABS8NBG2_9BACT|nr:hypothetical protein [Rhodopirellula sp. JC740]MCC9640894.1 hypothetical protein [Rhodopirellula sp. JC740]
MRKRIVRRRTVQHPQTVGASRTTFKRRINWSGQLAIIDVAEEDDSRVVRVCDVEDSGKESRSPSRSTSTYTFQSAIQ